MRSHRDIMVATSSQVREESWVPRSGGPAELRRSLLGFERGRSGRVPTSPHGLGVLALNGSCPRPSLLFLSFLTARMVPGKRSRT